MVLGRKICATGGIATTAPVAAPMTGRRAAQVVVGFRLRTPSPVPFACVAEARLAAPLALRGARPTGAQCPSVTLNRLADRYTAQRNGQGMSQLRQGTSVR